MSIEASLFRVQFSKRYHVSWINVNKDFLLKLLNDIDGPGAEAAYIETISRDLRECEACYQRICASLLHTPVKNPQELASMIQDVEMFALLNIEDCSELLRKHDETSPVQISAIFASAITREDAFSATFLKPILLRLKNLYHPALSASTPFSFASTLPSSMLPLSQISSTSNASDPSTVFSSSSSSSSSAVTLFPSDASSSSSFSSFDPLASSSTTFSSFPSVTTLTLPLAPLVIHTPATIPPSPSPPESSPQDSPTENNSPNDNFLSPPSPLHSTFATPYRHSSSSAVAATSAPLSTPPFPPPPPPEPSPKNFLSVPPSNSFASPSEYPPPPPLLGSSPSFSASSADSEMRKITLLLPAEDHIPVLLIILENMPCLWVCESSSCMHFDDIKLSAYHQRMNEQTPSLLRARWDGPLVEGANVKCKRKQCRRIRSAMLRRRSESTNRAGGLGGLGSGGLLPILDMTPRQASMSFSEQSATESSARSPRNNLPSSDTNSNSNASSSSSSNLADGGSQSLTQIRRVIRDELLFCSVKTEYLCTQWDQGGLRLKLYSHINSLRMFEATSAEEWTSSSRYQHCFPYSLLTIHAKTLLPVWLLNLISNYRVMNEFSKFLHATAVLYPDMVQIIPHWINNKTTRIESLRKGEDGVSLLTMLCEDSAPPRMPPILELADCLSNPAPFSPNNSDLSHFPSSRFLYGRSTASSICAWLKMQWTKTRPKLLQCSQRTKTFVFPPAGGVGIEPKTLLANERTYLQWFASGTFIGAVSSLAIDTPVFWAAYLFLPAAALIFLYAAYTNRKRLRLLETRQPSQSYADAYGPAALGLMLLAAFSASAFLAHATQEAYDVISMVRADCIVGPILSSNVQVTGFAWANERIYGTVADGVFQNANEGPLTLGYPLNQGRIYSDFRGLVVVGSEMYVGAMNDGTAILLRLPLGGVSVSQSYTLADLVTNNAEVFSGFALATAKTPMRLYAARTRPSQDATVFVYDLTAASLTSISSFVPLVGVRRVGSLAFTDRLYTLSLDPPAILSTRFNSSGSFQETQVLEACDVRAEVFSMQGSTLYIWSRKQSRLLRYQFNPSTGCSSCIVTH